MSLEALRRQIDELDSQLLGLLNARADLVHEIGLIKKAEGLQIYAPEREEVVFQNLVRKNAALNGRLPEKSVRAVYREIMSAALALEDDLKISYLGPPGTWTHQAAVSKFGASVTYTPQERLELVFDAVARRQADYGVVPIENSTDGASLYTLDLFTESPVRICAQLYLRIENCLMSNGARDEIDTLFSHASVFAQCRRWLLQHFPKATLREVASTTQAAAMAAATPRSGVLGGALCASLHGLTVLESSIQDNPTNTTRFLILSERTSPATGRDRTSLMFSVRNEPGALFKALAPFDALQLNLSMIESRPNPNRAWDPFLFIDVAGHCEDANVTTALAGLQAHCTFVKVLGSYPVTEDTTNPAAR
jgi:chorismate mutase / prephenate dehydratase